MRQSFVRKKSLWLLPYVFVFWQLVLSEHFLAWHILLHKHTYLLLIWQFFPLLDLYGQNPTIYVY